ncbi:restriction endonuclease subunit S [uncultured Helicobacter sp.]|uniref:restriction endonuclease subunit S n=1 Tax=uncultured Helicobacter sp. TaxID=175537 RepID=UPI00260F4F07|nr:restriction endonuclease subunit S [uncultured Helicobacter sp.]
MEYKELGELELNKILNLGRGKIISQNDLKNCPGEYPVYSSSATKNGEIGKYGRYMFDDERITWSIDGGGKFFYRNNLKYSVTNVCGWIKVTNTNELNTKYLFYALISEWTKKKFDYTKKAHPSVIKKEYQIPIPPLEIQQKIVEILDAFTELQAELQAELHARRKQYEYYRNKLLSFEELQRRTDMLNGGGLKLVTLGEVCEVKRGVRVTKKDLTENEKYPVFQNSLTPMGYYNQSNVNANTPFIIVGGSAGEIGWSSSSCWAADDCIYFICEKSLMNRFLYHALCNQQHYFLSQVRKASIPRLSQDCIKNLKIPLPPLKVQNDIVEILDKFDTLANDLSAGLPAEIEARQKQYEHYREQLLSFRENANKRATTK